MFIAFLNPQGNFDPGDSYWTEHPDFGGQLVYVKEVALALGRMGHRVDIVTRQIKDPEWPEFAAPLDFYPGHPNVRIVRIPCGPEHFLPKEELWPYLGTEWVPNLMIFYQTEGRFPDVLTTHYGDAGLCGALLQEALGLPYTFTGHSLGAQKMDKLGVTEENLAAMDARYHFARRLVAERVAMDRAVRIITSTRQERFNQYTHPAYRGAVDPLDDNRFAIIPPGVALDIFDRTVRSPREEDVRATIVERLRRDLGERADLPVIVASSRLDPKKNHRALLEAYAASPELQCCVNLVFITRGLDNPLQDYGKAGQTERAVLDDLMGIIAREQLRGKISMFSLESQEELAICYRFLAERRSVFALTALYEPFGLAPLEAMAAGLPVVVTKFGGPSESLREGDQDFGVLVDPTDLADIQNGLYQVLGDEERWHAYAKAGHRRVHERYTWERTAEGYEWVLERVLEVWGEHPIQPRLSIPPYFRNPTAENDISLDQLRELYLQLDLLAVGETVVDFISRERTNSLRQAVRFTRYLGGQPANVAVYVAKLDGRSAVLSKVGAGPFGYFLETELQRHGVSVQFLRHTDQSATTYVFVSHTPGVPDFEVIRQADALLNLRDVSEEAIRRARVVHTSTFALAREPSRSAVRRAVRLAHRHGKIITLDLNYHPRIWPDREEAWEVLAQILYFVDIVKPSLKDLRHLFEHGLSDAELERVALERLHDLGARVVIITRSGGPVTISHDGQIERVEDLPHVEVVDRTGAGDAFWAGLLVAHLDGLPWTDCVRVGHAVAKRALQTVGPFPRSISRETVYREVGVTQPLPSVADRQTT